MLQGLTGRTGRSLLLGLALLSAAWFCFGTVARAACTPDSFEPDNIAAQARPIAFGGPLQTHNLCLTQSLPCGESPGDQDWFTFTATAGTYYELEVATDDFLFEVLFGYSPTPSSIWWQQLIDRSATRWYWRASQSGTHYLKIRGYLPGTGTQGDTQPPPESAYVLRLHEVAPGTVAGRVVGAMGEPISGFGYEIGFYDLDGNEAFFRSDRLQDGGADFEYDLPPGTYKIRVNPNHYNEKEDTDYRIGWYPDALDAESAQTVTVAPGVRLTGLVIRLAAGGRIAGEVFGNYDRTYKTNVFAFDVSGKPFEATRNAVQTDGEGKYVFRGLPPGEYLVRFQPVWNPTEWYPDAASRSTAGVVSVSAGSPTTGINNTVDPVSSISGKYKLVPHSDSGVYVPRLWLWDVAADELLERDADFTPATAGLVPFSILAPAGEYRLFIGPYFIEDFGYASEWYENQPDYGSAPNISVAAGAEVVLNTIELENTGLGSLAGTVTGSRGQPLYHVQVRLHSGDGYPCGRTEYTDWAGNFRFIGLRPGSYRVLAIPDYANHFNNSTYLSSWYGGGATFGNEAYTIDAGLRFGNYYWHMATDGATPVTVSAGQETPGVEIRLNSAPAFANIPTQAAEVGAPLAIALVAEDAEGGQLSYAVENLPAGATFDPATHTFSWSPVAAQRGAHTVVFTVTDDGTPAGTDRMAVVLKVTDPAVNRVPFFTKGVDQTVTPGEGTQTVVSWATGISAGAPHEAGQTLNFIVANNNAGLFAVQPAISAVGTLYYAPSASATGSATVTVRLHDNGGTADGGVDTSDAQTFTISVRSVNRAPSFTAGPGQRIDEDAGARTVTGWATGISAGAAEESAQSLDFIVTNDNNALFAVQPAVAVDGTLRFTPAANASGSATVTVRLHDDGGTANGGTDTSAAQTFAITVVAVNDPPTLDALPPLTIGEDAGLNTVHLEGISAGPGEIQPLTVSAHSSNAGLIPNPAVSYLSPATTGSLRFTPVANMSGTATITVTVNDGQAANNTVVRTFLVTVTPAPDAPTGISLSSNIVNEGAPAGTTVGVLSTADPDSGDVFAYSIVGGDAAMFSVEGNLLKTAQVLDYAAGQPYTLRIRSTDSALLWTEKVFSVAPPSYVLWTRSDSGTAALWQVDPGQPTGPGQLKRSVYLYSASGVGAPWQASSYTHVSATEGYVLWTRSDRGTAALWQVDPSLPTGPSQLKRSVYLYSASGVGAPWQATSYTHVSATEGYVLWTRSDSGRAALWQVDPSLPTGPSQLKRSVYLYSASGVGAPWQATSYTHVSATEGYVLWTRSDRGTAALWQVDPSLPTGPSQLKRSVYLYSASGVGAPWQATSYTHVSATEGYVLWTRSDRGTAALWQVDPSLPAGPSQLKRSVNLFSATGVGAPWRATGYFTLGGSAAGD